MTSTSSSHQASQSRKATLSGWIGSALEYYDFFIYATASALIFPQLFFPQADPRIGIIASLATYGVGYVARPLGAFVLGHLGDTWGRKRVLVWCMFLMGASTIAVGFLPTYERIGVLAPALLVALRLVQGFAVAGEISGASSMILEHAPPRRRGFLASFTLQGVQAGQILAAAVFLPLAHFMPDDIFMSWGWRVPFWLSIGVLVAAWVIRSEVDETPIFARRKTGAKASAPVVEAFRHHWRDMLRVMCMALMNVIPVVATIFGATYAVQPAYGIGFDKGVYLWIPLVGNLAACICIPFVGALSDRIGRRPPIIAGALCSGLVAFAYLYAISIGSVALAFAMSVLMWGIVYQGYNAIFPAFCPELFPARVRVTGVAISQNTGTMLTAFLPVLFTAIAPPGTDHIWLTVAALAFAVTVVAAVAAFSARETFRVRTEDLGEPGAQPMGEEEYARLRAQTLAGQQSGGRAA